jgi:integrase/recombinase XerD
MPKKNRCGQASVFSDSQLDRISNGLRKNRDRALFDVLRYTGERGGAIVQLRWDDVDFHQDWIKFRAETRKGHEVREMPMHRFLKDSLQEWRRGCISPWLFPSRLTPEKHITYHGLVCWLGQILHSHGLHRGGYTPHSFRRTFITSLAKKGTSIKELMNLTGHKDVKSLMLYIEGDEVEQRKIINSL